MKRPSQMDTTRAEDIGHIYLALWERPDITAEIRDLLADLITEAYHQGWGAGSPSRQDAPPDQRPEHPFLTH